MRTPNCKCLVCETPLYRRPGELARVRHVACMAHRALAQSISGVTEAQKRGLVLGREKGTNHRTGYRHREESKRKASESNKRWCADNPDKVAARSEKKRGENAYNWKGGVSRLNTSIRQMYENRVWMDAIKARDGACAECGSTDDLEAHHEPSLVSLLEQYGIRNRDDARAHADKLWSMDGGRTLCSRCHDAAHGRRHRPRAQRKTEFVKCEACGVHFTVKPSRRVAKFCSRLCATAAACRRYGDKNPNWKGGQVRVQCRTCGGKYLVKPVRAAISKFCSRRCQHAAHQ